jgi:polysaccharide export outer membrane protein
MKCVNCLASRKEPKVHAKVWRLGRSVLVLALTSLAMLTSLRSQEERPALIPNAQGMGQEAKEAQTQTGSVTELTNDPIVPGETVHVGVFGAPDFTFTSRVSESGDIPFPVLGPVHIQGLNSQTAAAMLVDQLKKANLMPDPRVLVTVDSTASGITLLGEVRSPGIYPPPAKHMLSDLIAAAGGLTASTGRVIEITNDKNPGGRRIIPWDPTLRNIDSFDTAVHPGDRIIVRACGIAYVGGHVMKPGAYSLCGSSQLTVSEVIALAGGISPLTDFKHTYLVRTQQDGTKTVTQLDVQKILEAKVADPAIREDDILYVSPSAIKDAITRAMGFALSLAGPLLYTYR